MAKKWVLDLGKVAYYRPGGPRTCPAELTVEVRDTKNGPELSVTGGIWNHIRTDFVICGAGVGEWLLPYFKGNRMVARLIAIGERWHLNGLRAGTPRQTEALKDAGRMEYGQACDYLAARGLNPDNGYAYGASWLYEPIPADILAEVARLCEALDREPVTK